MIKSLKYCLVVIVALYSCSPVTTSSVSSLEAHNEDLTVYRPTFDKVDTLAMSKGSGELVDITYPEPQFDVTNQLHTVLDSINQLKADRSYVDGYTIQVYSGTNSEEAKIARGRIYSLVDGFSPSLKYDEPNFKVKVGNYFTRLEAQNDFSKLKSKFPNSIIIPQRIYIANIDR